MGWRSDRTSYGNRWQRVWKAGCAMMGRKLVQLVLYGCCGCFAVSCSFLAGPAYKRPELPNKESWSESSGSRVSAAETIQPEWWKKFGDPYLDQLVQRAIKGGFDLKILAAQLEAAGAGIETEKAELLPTVAATGERKYSRGKVEILDPEFGEPIPRSDSTKFKTDIQSSAGFELNWQIDFWGKTQKRVLASKANYKATEADWRAGYLTLVSSVAQRYFEIRQFDEQITQQQATLKSNVQLLEIYKAQFKEGLVAESQLLSQQAEINNLEQELLELRRQRKVTELTLSTLLGIPAGNLKVPTAPLTGTVKEVEVPLVLPGDLLSRRPDIIAQEYRVLAAHELVGEARLARLPSISLLGNATSGNVAFPGFQTVSLGITPSLNIPIFDPRISANIRATTAAEKQAEQEYKKTVITAYEEVETVVANLASRRKQKRELKQQIRNLSIVRDVRYAQLKEGLVSQLEVFDTDRTLLSAHQALLQLHQQILTDTVTLYKALGGGWSAQDLGEVTP